MSPPVSSSAWQSGGSSNSSPNLRNRHVERLTASSSLEQLFGEAVSPNSRSPAGSTTLGPPRRSSAGSAVGDEDLLSSTSSPHTRSHVALRDRPRVGRWPPSQREASEERQVSFNMEK